MQMFSYKFILIRRLFPRPYFYPELKKLNEEADALDKEKWVKEAAATIKRT